MQYQHLVFEEFGRAVSPTIDPFVFSNSSDINPAIFAEFANVVYRFGHSMLTETVDRTNMNMTSDDIGLIQAFLNPLEFNNSNAAGVETITEDVAVGAIVRGMSRQVGNAIDEFVTEALRNNLVGLPLDLAVLNMARARDTGMPSFNEARAQFFAMTGDCAARAVQQLGRHGAEPEALGVDRQLHRRLRHAPEHHRRSPTPTASAPRRCCS